MFEPNESGFLSKLVTSDGIIIVIARILDLSGAHVTPEVSETSTSAHVPLARLYRGRGVYQ